MSGMNGCLWCGCGCCRDCYQYPLTQGKKRCSVCNCDNRSWMELERKEGAAS